MAGSTHDVTEQGVQVGVPPPSGVSMYWSMGQMQLASLENPFVHTSLTMGDSQAPVLQAMQASPER
jgi:hypothetical protein